MSKFLFVKERSKPEIEKTKAAGEPLGIDLHLSLGQPGAKTFDTIKENGQIVDYRNITIKGYLSTFGNVDRDGEYVLPGAFQASIPQFMANPVLLTDHENSVESVAGKFTTVREDDKGLYIEAKITDSPSDCARDIRHKIVNDEIRTLSMGGFFSYGGDGMAITKVSLYEGSLTPIPANANCAFSTRSLNAEMKVKAMSQLMRLGKVATVPGQKLMDKPTQYRVSNPSDTAQSCSMTRWNADSVSSWADGMSDWAADQGTSDANQEAQDAHGQAQAHCSEASELMKSAGNTATAAHLERMARRHGDEQTMLQEVGKDISKAGQGTKASKPCQLNSDAASLAEGLISKGQIDSSGNWTAPSATSADHMITADGYGEWSKWYLGKFPGATDGTKGAFGYPFSSDFHKVSVAGLRAIITRAGQAGAGEVEAKARKLLEAVKAKLGQ